MAAVTVMWKGFVETSRGGGNSADIRLPGSAFSRHWGRSRESRGVVSVSCGHGGNVGRFPEQLRGVCRESVLWCVRASDSGAQVELESAEEVRDQLEALQDEAQQVRRRANSARARFMRLTDAVEQLRQRAAMDVRQGHEANARLLLEEKQKVMKALEAARRRAELLEQLAGKLNLAISIKETQLIAALSCARLDVAPEVSIDTTIRVVSPSEQEAEGVQETDVTEVMRLGKITLETDKDLPANDRVTSRIEELSQWSHEDSEEPSANRLEADLFRNQKEDSEIAIVEDASSSATPSRIEELSQWSHEDSEESSANSLEADLFREHKKDLEIAIVEDALSSATPNLDFQTEYSIDIDKLRTALPIIQSQPEPSEPHVPEEVSSSALSTEASVSGLNGEGDWSDRGNYELGIIRDISQLKKAEARLELLEERAQAEILEFDKVREGLSQPIENSLMQSDSEGEGVTGSTKESSLSWAASDGDMGSKRAQEELHGAFVQNLDNSLKLSEHIVNDCLYTTSLMLETVKDLSMQHQSMRIMYPQLSNLQDEESTGGDTERSSDGGTVYKSLQKNVSYEEFVHDLYTSLKNSENSFDEISKLASPLLEALNELSKQLQNVRARIAKGGDEE